MFPPEETLSPWGLSCYSITFPMRSLGHTEMIPLEGG